MSDRIEDSHLDQWQHREAIAENLIPLIGQLYRQFNVVTSLFGRAMVNRSVMRIIKDHRFVRHIEGEELDVALTERLLQALIRLNPGPAHIDVGKLGTQFRKEAHDDLDAFLRRELASIVDQHDTAAPGGESQDVVLYGFGRIGRLLARIMIEKAGGGSKLRLRAVVVRGGKAGDLQKRASLLRRDSVHGPFHGTIQVDESNSALIVNGNYIRFIYANSPAEVDYSAFGIHDALVVDNTGVWRDAEGLGKHLDCNGAKKVLLTAPGKGELKNIVFGVNHGDIADNDTILSAASCTTNAIVPVLKALNDKFGVVEGHVETVHSYTNDQNLIDNFHSGERRGRSAPLNMVLTETGAAKAVAKALPELAGKLTGNAIRVPTANVSMAILNLTLVNAVTKDELNEYLRWASIYSPMQKQIDFVDSPEVVSSDFVGNRHAGIVDGKATITNDKRVVLYVWYDNEFGYSCQVVRVLQRLAKLQVKVFPQDH
ncbi:glyceraldehyde-3-phosphate dehydrogenase [Salinispirillum sp. LH 10-3-1]|uniref:Glyceraldehyde-3-phosphate dehydrogenase n=1 Tax=Salinispirillum sp. LH 10-3-1 TaxID=2952525 RepID=A0AB38YBG1_9GAMM